MHKRTSTYIIYTRTFYVQLGFFHADIQLTLVTDIPIKLSNIWFVVAFRIINNNIQN